MAIRKNTNPRMMDLQPEMQDILRRNGMQAHVVSDGTGYRLVVQGHDSPLLTYDLTERQMLALTDWGDKLGQQESLQRVHEHCRERLLYAQELRPYP